MQQKTRSPSSRRYLRAGNRLFSVSGCDLTMLHDTDRAATFWDRQTEVGTLEAQSWMAHPRVRDYINGLIGGDVPRWPHVWLRDSVNGRRFRRALSIGCGAGAFERSLLEIDLCDEIDAFDAGIYSLHTARKAAAEAGFGDRIHYYAADFNHATIPAGRYDLIVCHQSLHHVGRLERLFLGVLHGLAPEGLLFFDEYIGPSREEWNEPSRIEEQRRIYENLPREWRTRDRLYPPIEVNDPSEAARSSEIIPLLDIGFDVVARRDYGGVILAVLLSNIDWSRAPVTLADDFIELDRAHVAAGDTLHAVVIAEPVRGLHRTFARLRYFWEPKLKYSWKYTVMPAVKRRLKIED